MDRYLRENSGQVLGGPFLFRPFFALTEACLKFPNLVSPNAVRCRKEQELSAIERKRKHAKWHKRVIPCKMFKQPGLKHPFVGKSQRGIKTDGFQNSKFLF